MTFFAKAGHLTADATGTPSATQTVSGLGFTPVAIIMWAQGRTATGWGAAANQQQFTGWSDGTTHRAMASASEDNSTTADAQRRLSTKVCCFIDVAGTVTKEATVAFASGQFTLTWTTNDATAYLIHYLVIGGSDVQAKVASFGAGSAAANESETGVGFQPTAMFLMGGNSSDDTSNTSSSWGIGAVDSAGHQWMHAERVRDNNVANTSWRYQRTDSCIATMGNASESQRASFVSFDADGFTLNWKQVASQNFAYLCLKGLQSFAGAFNKATGGAPASQSVTGVGFTPVAVMFSTFATTSTTAIQTSERHGFGAMDDAGTEESAAVANTSGLSPSNVNLAASTTKVLMVNDANAASSEAEADYTSMDGDGFTISWSTNNGTAHEILFFAFAGLASTNPEIATRQGWTLFAPARHFRKARAFENNLTLNTNPLTLLMPGVLFEPPRPRIAARVDSAPTALIYTPPPAEDPSPVPFLATPIRKRWAPPQPPESNVAVLDAWSTPRLAPQLPHVIPARRRPQPPRPPENGSLAALFGRVTVVLTDGMRLRAEVYTPAGALAGSGPIRAILSAEYEVALDRIGGWSMTVAATDANASLLTMGREVRLYREGEGLVYRGFVDKAETQVSESGELTVVASGLSTAEALLWANTLLGRAFNGTALSSVVSTLLTGTGWSAGSLDVPSTTLLARYDGLSRWAALQKAADVFGLHLREDPYNLEADIGAFGTSSGVTFQNVGQVSPVLRENTLLYPVQSLQVEDEASDLWNSIVPLGGGDTLNQLTLRYATRSVAGGFAYDVQSAAGPDGLTYYYLEDAASVAAYGRRQRVLLVKDAAPLANSSAGYQNAANALYDVAVTYLQRHKDPLTTYGVSVLGMKHFDPGSTTPRFQVGQKARLVYRGIVEDTDGTRRAWRSVDASLWLMGFKRSFKDDGSDEWSLSVATVDRLTEDDAQKQAQAFSDLFALQVALKHYTSHEVHILQRSSIDASNTTTLTVKWDANVSLIHQAKLTFKILPVRSNVSTVADGGGTSPTTSSGGSSSPTSSSGGATTSSAGDSHTHSWTGNTTGGAGGTIDVVISLSTANHNHSSATTDSTASANPDPGHSHVVSGGTGNTDVGVTMASNPNKPLGSGHTHGFSGVTVGSEATHTHTIGNHTHTVTISAHTHTVTLADHSHALTYGIYIASNPVSTALNITINGTNRTVALGGSWSTVNSEIEVDITQYLQSGSTEIPLQQSNTIVFSGAVLADVEAVLRSRVTVASLVPV